MTDPTPIITPFWESIVRQYIGGILVAATTGAVAVIVRFIICLRRLNRRGWRTTQAVLLMSELIDDETAELHPDHKGRHEIADKIKNLLKDEDGKL